MKQTKILIDMMKENEFSVCIYSLLQKVALDDIGIEVKTGNYYNDLSLNGMAKRFRS